MSKTLTEQWREGTLKTGSYYIRTITGNEKSDYFEGKKFCFWNDYEVEEVLAPVPSYTELTLMAGNYRLAKKALRDCYNEMKYWATMNHRCSKIFNHIKAALVEIEEVK